MLACPSVSQSVSRSAGRRTNAGQRQAVDKMAEGAGLDAAGRRQHAQRREAQGQCGQALLGPREIVAVAVLPGWSEGTMADSADRRNCSKRRLLSFRADGPSNRSACCRAAAPMATNAGTSLLMCDSETAKLTYSFAFWVVNGSHG